MSRQPDPILRRPLNSILFQSAIFTSLLSSLWDRTPKEQHRRHCLFKDLSIANLRNFSKDLKVMYMNVIASSVFAVLL